jgi:hypothetical protein
MSQRDSFRSAVAPRCPTRGLTCDGERRTGIRRWIVITIDSVSYAGLYAIGDPIVDAGHGFDSISLVGALAFADAPRRRIGGLAGAGA